MSTPPTSPKPSSDLHQALRGLPEMKAPPGFTEAVLRRTREGEQTAEPTARPGLDRHRSWLALAAAAAMMALILGLGGFRLLHDRPTGSDRTAELEIPAGIESPNADSPRDRLDRMRQEHELLRRELESLREVTRSDSPYLYLAGDEQVEFVWGFADADF